MYKSIIKKIYYRIFTYYHNFRSKYSYQENIKTNKDICTTNDSKSRFLEALKSKNIDYIELGDSVDNIESISVSVSCIFILTETLKGLIKSGGVCSIGNNRVNDHFLRQSLTENKPVKLTELTTNGDITISSYEYLHIYFHRVSDNVIESLINNYSFKKISDSLIEFNNNDFRFPVDIVYTWVNGSDPTWLEKKNKYDVVNNLVPDSNTSNRYTSFDELKYSIRSVLTHAPWVRKIYIVTDRQVPDWFAENSRVKIVDHQDIFKEIEYLPVFNSHAIEANLHNIPGLSENFIYFNDDVFLRSQTKKSDFFSPFGHRFKFFYSNQAYLEPRTTDLTSVDCAGLNNSKFLKQNYGFNTYRKFQHTPIPLKISAIRDLEKKHPDVFYTTSRSKFRSSSDYSILSSLIKNYSYIHGFAEASTIRYDYFNSSSPSFVRDFNKIYTNKKSVKSFCINNTENLAIDSNILQTIVEELLVQLYPYSSICEKENTGKRVNEETCI